MYDYFCSIMNSSKRIGVSGARPYRVWAETKPIDSKILVFILSIQLIGYFIMNCIGDLQWTFCMFI